MFYRTRFNDHDESFLIFTFQVFGGVRVHRGLSWETYRQPTRISEIHTPSSDYDSSIKSSIKSFPVKTSSSVIWVMIFRNPSTNTPENNDQVNRPSKARVQNVPNEDVDTHYSPFISHVPGSTIQPPYASLSAPAPESAPRSAHEHFHDYQSAWHHHPYGPQ